MANNSALLILNPVSGMRTSLLALTPIVKALSAQGCDATVHLTTHAGDATDYARLYGGDYSRILVCGGDGTLSEVFRGLIAGGHDVPVGYIPTGTTNDLAHALRLPTELNAAIRNAVSGTPHAHDIGILNDNVYFDYVAAFGAFTQVSYTTSQIMKNQLGHTAYIIEGIKHLPIGQYHTATIISEDRVYHGDFVYCSVSNSTSIGGMNIPDKIDVSMDDGLFEVCLIKAPKSVSDVQSIITAIITQNFDSQYVTYFKTRRLHFEFEKETPWTLDGEFGGNIKTADISVVNKAIGILK
jgi:YegS/Rv2252/BmrU family lipid kinase